MADDYADNTWTSGVVVVGGTGTPDARARLQEVADELGRGGRPVRIVVVPGPVGAVTACHCGQCRSLSGHYSASFDVAEAALDWQARDGLAEYRTAGGGVRGFCGGCGSSLWFRAADGGFSVEAGAVDGPTGGRLALHIFVGEKGSYYDIDDGLPQFSNWD